MASSTPSNLKDLIKQITINFISHYYHKFETEYLATAPIIGGYGGAQSPPQGTAIIADSKIREFVHTTYDTKQLELKKYIRKTLKDNLKEQYPTTAVEQILLEMFSNPDYAKERVTQEIILDSQRRASLA
jgi:hypothetical protein